MKQPESAEAQPEKEVYLQNTIVVAGNFTDRAYRRARSRWDEMGINFIAGVTLRT
ncbi:MAG: hypothetical protein V1694_07125 [Candidatus Eisenbacteria bacterium]